MNLSLSVNLRTFCTFFGPCRDALLQWSNGGVHVGPSLHRWGCHAHLHCSLSTHKERSSILFSHLRCDTQALLQDDREQQRCGRQPWRCDGATHAPLLLSVDLQRTFFHTFSARTSAATLRCDAQASTTESNRGAHVALSVLLLCTARAVVRTSIALC